MRVVVTGGAGFVGTAVVAALRDAGVDVGVVDTLRPDVHRDGGVSARRRLSESGIPLVVADVRDLAATSLSFAGADAVVHLAAKVGLGVDLDDVDDYVSTNDFGTAVVLRAAAHAGVRRLVQASSMVVYGEGRYRCPEHGESAAPPRDEQRLAAGRFEPACPRCGADLVSALVGEDAPMDPRNTYAATKVHQEHLAAVWARETGSAAVSLRLHNVYGPGMPRSTPYAGVAAIFRSALERGEAPRVFEDGGQRRDFVHVDDVARAFVAALHGTPGGHAAYNVGSGVVHTVGDLATELARAAGGPAPVVTGQYRLGDVRHITASSGRAREALGWAARVGLREGVAALGPA